MEASNARRRRAERWGRAAETFATIALVCKGFWPIAARLKTPLGEVDLVMRRAGLIAIVEVKARKSLEDAVDAVTPRARHRIAAAAHQWIAHQPDLASCALRFDIVACAPWRWPRHIPDAWRP